MGCGAGGCYTPGLLCFLHAVHHGSCAPLPAGSGRDPLSEPLRAPPRVPPASTVQASAPAPAGPAEEQQLPIGDCGVPLEDSPAGFRPHSSVEKVVLGSY